MILSFQNSEQQLSKFVNFWNSRKFPPRVQQFPGIPEREFLGWRIPENSRELPNGNSRWPWFRVIYSLYVNWIIFCGVCAKNYENWMTVDKVIGKLIWLNLTKNIISVNITWLFNQMGVCRWNGEIVHSRVHVVSLEQEICGFRAGAESGHHPPESRLLAQSLIAKTSCFTLCRQLWIQFFNYCQIRKTVVRSHGPQFFGPQFRPTLRRSAFYRWPVSVVKYCFSKLLHLILQKFSFRKRGINRRRVGAIPLAT